MLIYWTDTNGGDFDTAGDWQTDQVPPNNQVPGVNDVAAMVAQAPANYVVDDDDGTTTTVTGFTTGPETIFQITNDSIFVATDGTATGANLGQVTVGDNSELEIGGTLDNADSLSLTGAGTKLQLLAPSLVDGGGTITLSNAAMVFDPVKWGETTAFTNPAYTNVNNTIEGFGSITFLSQPLTIPDVTFANEKDGVIDATGPLTITGNQIQIANSGLLEATDGGQLNIDDAVIDDGVGGGTILAQGLGSLVELQEVLITGGIFNTPSFGEIEFVGSANSVSGPTGNTVTNKGTLDVADDAAVQVSGLFDNSGGIDLEGAGDPTTLSVVALTTFEGGGSIFLADSANNMIEGAGSTPVNVDNVNNNISGSGAIDNITLDNEKLGTVDATGDTAPLIIEGNFTPNVTNTGMLEGSGTQGLELLDCQINNTSGVIEAANDSEVALFGSDISDGTLECVGTGEFISRNSLISDVSFTGSLLVNNGNVLGLSGTIKNNGEISIDGSGSPTTLFVSTTVVLEGDGQVQLSNSSDNIITAEDPASVIENDGNTIEGSGIIEDLVLRNEAGSTIAANGAAPLSINTGSNTIVNAGTLAAEGGSELYLGSPVSNSGDLDANGGYITAADAVTGGVATINALGEIELGAASDTEVKFVPGSEGVLILDDAVQYTGTIVGFNAAEAIDLTDISSATMSYSAGVLTINGGTGDVAHLHFSGSFTLSEFALTGDGGNGLILTDPPAATNAANAAGATNIALLGSYMAAAFATAGAGQASAATAESEQVSAMHLTLPHA